MPKTHYLLDSADILRLPNMIAYLKRSNISHITLINQRLNVDGNLSYAFKACHNNGISVVQVLSPYDCSLAADENDPGKYLGQTQQWMEYADNLSMELSEAKVDSSVLNEELAPLRKEQNCLRKAITEKLINKDTKISELQIILTKPKNELGENNQRLKDMLGYYFQNNNLPHIKDATDANKTIEDVIINIQIEMDAILKRDVPEEHRLRALIALDTKEEFYSQYFTARKVRKTFSLSAMYQRCKAEGLIAADDTVVFVGEDPETNNYASLRAYFPYFLPVTAKELNPDADRILREHASAAVASRPETITPTATNTTASELPVITEPNPGKSATKLESALANTRKLLTTANGQRVSKEIISVISTVEKIFKQTDYTQIIETYIDLINIVKAVNTAIETPTKKNIDKCKTYAQQVQSQASPLWQGLGIALMALGAALIILGALVATSTVGLATIPGASLITAGVTATQAGLGTVAAGSAALLGGSLFTFFGQKSGLAKNLEHLSTALEKANPDPKPASDSATVPLLQKP